MGQPADAARRVLGSLIDGTVVFLVSLMVGVWSLSWMPNTNTPIPLGVLALVGWLDLVVVVGMACWLYSGVIGRHGLCLGHLTCKMRVVETTTGSRLASWRGALRAVPVAIPMLVGFALAPLLGYATIYAILLAILLSAAATWLTVVVSPQLRGWNDRVAGAAVIRR